MIKNLNDVMLNFRQVLTKKKKKNMRIVNLSTNYI